MIKSQYLNSFYTSIACTLFAKKMLEFHIKPEKPSPSILLKKIKAILFKIIP